MSRITMETSSFVSLLFYLINIKIVTPDNIVGFDCSGAQWKSYLRYSAVNVQACPKAQAWFEEERPVEVQVIRNPQISRLKVFICEVKVTRYAHYCWFNSQVYGTEYQLDTDIVHELTRSQCQDLVYRNTLHFKGNTWEGKGTNFTREAVTEGWRDSESGKCSPSDKPFSFGEVVFNHHLLREVVTASVREHEFEYLEDVDQLGFELSFEKACRT